jgi:SAM-dependent methyltransferase
MFEAEDRHWWYAGNHENFLSILKRKKILRNGIRVLDAGCGTGRWLQILKNACRIEETGVDQSDIALKYAKSRADLNLVQGDINRPLFPESSFDLITSFDLIYHLDVDDETAIRNFRSYLDKGGYLLLTVPAFSFLYSRHDEVVHTKKRYTRKELRELIERNGFGIEKITYCVSLLFPFALVKRVFDRIHWDREKIHNEVEIPPRLVNRLFLMVMRMENFLLRFLDFPFGLSLLVLAKIPPPSGQSQPLPGSSQ